MAKEGWKERPITRAIKFYRLKFLPIKFLVNFTSEAQVAGALVELFFYDVRPRSGWPGSPVNYSRK